MRKKAFCSMMFMLCNAILFSQTTKVSFLSSVEIPIFEIERLAIEDSKSMISSVDASLSSMKLVGVSPFSLEIGNGGHILNAGGLNEYNKSFVLNAQGGNITVRILGDPIKAKEMNYWTLAVGLTVPLSFQGMLALFPILDSNQKFIAVGLPILSCGAFIASFSLWILNIPRIEIAK